MLKKVLKAIEKYEMLSFSKEVTVALSGGADSVCLLYALLNLKEKLGITVAAAHLNHCLRGEESERDEAFVRTLCENLSVPLTVAIADIKAEAQKTGESIELAARRIRYEFLEKAANGGIIATAHTASDSLETVLFNLTRGTAIKGLMGIPAVRYPFIRPLIFVTRREVEEYCKENGICFVTDSSNLTDDYTRNKLRHNVVPTLKSINPSLENTVLRTAEILSEDNDFLEKAAENAFSLAKMGENLSAEKLMEMHIAIRKRVIKLFLEEKGIEAFSVNINEVLSILPLGKIMLPSGIILESKNGILSVCADIKTAEYITECFVLEREEFEKQKNVNSLLLKNALDYDKIVGKPILRKKTAGDKIRISGRGVTKTLKKLCTEEKVAIEKRDNLPVIADEEGVIWAHGFGVSERVAITNLTKKFLIVKSEIKTDF